MSAPVTLITGHQHRPGAGHGAAPGAQGAPGVRDDAIAGARRGAAAGCGEERGPADHGLGAGRVRPEVHRAGRGGRAQGRRSDRRPRQQRGRRRSRCSRAGDGRAGARDVRDERVRADPHVPGGAAIDAGAWQRDDRKHQLRRGAHRRRVQRALRRDEARARGGERGDGAGGDAVRHPRRDHRAGVLTPRPSSTRRSGR